LITVLPVLIGAAVTIWALLALLGGERETRMRESGAPLAPPMQTGAATAPAGHEGTKSNHGK
jgi:hypothetical protein